MRLLLISENRTRDNLVPYPLGISYAAAAADRAGHDVEGLDLMFSEDPAADIRKAIEEFEPDCFGLSIRNIDNQDMRRTVFYPESVSEIVDAIRSCSDRPVIAGGAGFTIFPLECLEYLGLELGVVGEAEASFPALLERLESGADISGVPGLAIRKGGRESLNRLVSYPDISTAGPPDRDCFDVRRYNWIPEEGPPFIANLQSRRGCHMRCIYCSTPDIEGRHLRLREPGLVADELASLESEYGIRTASFVDSLFNHPARYARELCLCIIERDTSARWMCNYNPAGHDPGLPELMRRAGCFQVSLGNESGSDHVLSALRKGFTKNDISNAVRDIKEAGMAVNCFLLLGGPGETHETVKESVEFVESLEPDMVTVTPGIRIYPGCELERIAVEEGVIAAGSNLLRPVFYLSTPVRSWLYDYAQEACRTHENWRI